MAVFIATVVRIATIRQSPFQETEKMHDRNWQYVGSIYSGRKKLKITRSCLEIIQRKGFGLAIQTKSAGILRDLD